MICKNRWYAEKTAALLSAAVATVEVDPVKAKLFQQMTLSSRQHGEGLGSETSSHASGPPCSVADWGPRTARNPADPLGL